MARLKVGLLGGSFNPAHEGHRHVSLIALRRLRLDQVWWLVSPQNPLKSTAGMAPLEERLAQARQVAAHPRIRATDIEARLGTRYTVDTLTALRRRFPDIRFVWLMGADNLLQLPHWHRWETILETVPVAIFDRPSYSYRALASAAAQRFGRHRVSRPETLADAEPPAWCYLWVRRHPASATAIRRQRRNRVPKTSRA